MHPRLPRRCGPPRSRRRSPACGERPREPWARHPPREHESARAISSNFGGDVGPDGNLDQYPEAALRAGSEMEPGLVAVDLAQSLSSVAQAESRRLFDRPPVWQTRTVVFDRESEPVHDPARVDAEMELAFARARAMANRILDQGLQQQARDVGA